MHFREVFVKEGHHDLSLFSSDLHEYLSEVHASRNMGIRLGIWRTVYLLLIMPTGTTKNNNYDTDLF